jgi:hypothetical protein
MVDCFLVGAPGVGTRVTGATAAALFSQPPRAGNQLLAVVKGASTTAQSTGFSVASGTGWSLMLAVGNAASFTARVEVWTKVAAGADAAPTFNVMTGASRVAQVTTYELFNPNATPLDVSGTKASGGTSSSITSAVLSTATSANVSGAGEFGIYAYAGQSTTVATNAWGVGAGGWTGGYNDGASSSQLHVADQYHNNPTSGAVLTASPTITTFTGFAASLVITIADGSATFNPGDITPAARLISANSAGLTTFGVPAIPGIVQANDLLVVGVKITTSTISVSTISDAASSNITTGWTRVAGPFVDNEAGNIRSQEIWIGKATGTGATTLTFTYSASNAGLATDIDFQEFTTGYSFSSWARDGTQQASQNNVAATTHSWPTLTASAPGLFVGTCRAIGGSPYRTTGAATGCGLDTNGQAFLYKYSYVAGSVANGVFDVVSCASHTLGVLLDYTNVWPVAGAADADTMDATGTLSLNAMVAGTADADTLDATGAVTIITTGAILAVAGSSATASSAAGTISATGVISGSSATASAASGAIVLLAKVAGSSSTASAANGTISLTGVVSGSSATASTASGAIVQTLVLSGSSATTSTASGAVSRFTPLAGSSVTVPVANGTVTLIGIVAGSSATASSATGSLTRLTPLAGSSSTASSATGAVTISTGAIVYQVAGSSVASSVATGAVGQIMVVAGSSATASSAAGTLGTLGVVVGTSATASSAAGTITAILAVAGSSATLSAASGSVSRAVPLAGSSATGSSGSGAVTIATGVITYTVAGLSSTGSSASGSISRLGMLAGASLTASTASGTITLRLAVSGLATASSVASGAISGLAALAGSAVTGSRADGSVVMVLRLAGLSATGSYAAGSVEPPFIPGLLPPVITAIVQVRPGPRVTIGINVVHGSATVDRTGARIEIDKVNGTVVADRLRAEVT